MGLAEAEAEAAAADCGRPAAGWPGGTNAARAEPARLCGASTAFDGDRGAARAELYPLLAPAGARASADPGADPPPSLPPRPDDGTVRTGRSDCGNAPSPETARALAAGAEPPFLACEALRSPTRPSLGAPPCASLSS